MTRTTAIICISLLLAVSASAQQNDSSPPDLVVHCGNLLDVEAGELTGERWIEVAGNRIASITDTRPDADAETVGGADLTCLPGLMDMHVHLDGQLSPDGYLKRFQQNPADYALLAAHYADKTLKAGFTTVRNPGDAYNATIALRDAIRNGTAQGPRIFTAGKSLATTGGHADPTNGYRYDLMGDPGPAQGVVNGVADARKAVRQRYKDGADFIKITATGGVLSLASSGDNPQFTEAELAEIIAIANDYGMHVAAHAHGAAGMLRAVQAGVKSIEHGTYMTDEIMQAMKDNGTWYVPTIAAGKFVAEKSREEGYFPAVVRPKAAAVGPQIQDTFAQAWEAGVPIAFGTDSGVSPHGDNAKEFAYMVEVGMPAIEAIRSATINSAELLGMSEQLGTLETGKLADIVLVDGNPLEDVSVLESVETVIKNGQRVR